VHTVLLVQLLIEFTDNLHLLMSHSLMCQFSCRLLCHKQWCLLYLYCFVLFFSSLSLLYRPPIFVLPQERLHILHCNFFLCNHCSTFPRDRSVQLLVFYHGKVCDAAAGYGMLACLSTKEINACVLLVNTI
jgi:hypothetical protein